MHWISVRFYEMGDIIISTIKMSALSIIRRHKYINSGSKSNSTTTTTTTTTTCKVETGMNRPDCWEPCTLPGTDTEDDIIIIIK